jgi:hypothetical protein
MCVFCPRAAAPRFELHKVVKYWTFLPTETDIRWMDTSRLAACPFGQLYRIGESKFAGAHLQDLIC